MAFIEKVAFHHIDEPIRLLRTINERLLKKSYIIIVGEHYFTMYDYHKRAIKHFVKYLTNYLDYRKMHHFYPSWQDLFPPDFEKGDIHWSLSEYNFIFKKSGFQKNYHNVHQSNLYQSFLLKK